MGRVCVSVDAARRTVGHPRLPSPHPRKAMRCCALHSRDGADDAARGLEGDGCGAAAGGEDHHGGVVCARACRPSRRPVDPSAPRLPAASHPVPPRHPARNLPCCVLDTDGRMRRMMMSAWVAWVHGCRGDRVGATRTRGQQCPVVGCVVLYPPPLCPWRCVRRHRLWRYSTRVIPSPTRRCSAATTPHLHWAPPLFTFPPKSYSVRQARG